MEVHQGYLTVKISGFLKDKVLTNCWCILYGGKRSFPPRLDVHEDKHQVHSAMCKKSIDIIGAKWGEPETFEPAFCFYVKSKRYLFIVGNKEECDVWLQYLLCLSPDLFASHHMMKTSGQGGIGGDDGLVVEQNIIYSASNDDAHLFEVAADQHGCCSKFGFVGLLKLKIDEESIKLYEVNATDILAEWTYYGVRTYGHSKYTLNISVGKKSSTGEGNFSFMTVEGSKIVELIGYNTKKLHSQKAKIGNKTDGINKTSGSTLSNSLSSAFSSKKKAAPAVPTKPVSPQPVSSPGLASLTNVFDVDLKKELNNTIGSNASQRDTKPPLELKKSNSNRSSIESLGKIDGKKLQKEKEKLAKKQEKEEKKQEKEREKREKERQKQLEKMAKQDAKGKGKLTVPEKSYLNVEESVYSEAYDAPQPDGNPYSVCDYGISKNTPRQHKVESQLYNQPWGGLPEIVNPQNTIVDEDEECVYAAPAKPNFGKGIKHMPSEEDSYEDVEPRNVSPPVIPMKSDTLLNEESNNNVYDHFVEVSPSSDEMSENVYGLESAKPLVRNRNVKNVELSPSDTYDTVG